MSAVTSGAHTLGTPYFNFSSGLAVFYAARGMWAEGAPRGWLATALGPRMWPGRTWFYASAEQVGELLRDLAENGPRGLSSKQLAQSQRRLREALTKAGERAPAAAVGGDDEFGAVVPRRVTPFHTLVCPPAGKAKEAFIHHAWNCLTEIVDAQQTAAYAEECQP